MKIDGKTIIVTGANNCIGQELVTILLSKDCNVIAVDLKKPVFEETTSILKEKKGSLTIFAADITDEESVELLYENIIANCGPVDVIINNAGINQPNQSLNSLKYEDIENIFDINYYGLLYISKFFLPHLLSRPEAYLIISNGVFLTVSQQASFKTSKIRSTLKMLIEGLHSALLDTNVNVSIVFSGFINNNNNHNYSTLSSPKAAMEIINGMENNYTRIDIVKKVKSNVKNSDSIKNIIKRKIKTLYNFFSPRLTNETFEENQNNLI